LVNQNSLVDGHVAAEMQGIFHGHAAHQAGHEPVVGQGFGPRTHGSRTMFPSRKASLAIMTLGTILLVIADVAPHSTAHVPTVPISPQNARHESKSARNLLATEVSNGAKEAPARPFSGELSPAKLPLGPTSLISALARPSSINDGARPAGKSRTGHAAIFAHDTVETRQPGAPSSVAASLPRLDRNCDTRPGADAGADDCWGRNLMWADDRLVHSYNDAVHAGVPRSQLLHYRSKWLAARRWSRVDPASTIRDYDQLSVDLQDEARDAQSAQEPAGE
jgi:hypothetical protein